MGILSRLFPRADHAAPPLSKRSFDAAGGGRRGSAFRSFGSTGPETLAAAGPLRSRARHAYANNGYLRNAVNAWVAEVVGAGIEANSAHPETDMRPLIDAQFQTAMMAMDAEGRTDLRGLTAAAVQSVIVDGEALFMIEESPAGVRLRQIPAELLNETKTGNLADGGFVVAGVEFAADGTRRAYHLHESRPTDIFNTSHKTIRIAADDVLHVFKPLGPGQVRGVSWLAPILLPANELEQLQDALLVGAKIVAMHCGFIVDQTNLGGGAALPEAEFGDVSLEPGVVRQLPGGYDIKFSSPDQAKDSIAFAKLTLGQIAAGLGLPQHLVDGDLSGANYSSLRAGLLTFRAKVEQFTYHTLIPQMLDPVFKRVVMHHYLAGDIDVPDLAPALKAEWLPPRPMQVDPLKDTAALEKKIALGLTSRRQAVASLGWNISDLDAEISADRERESALNLNFSGGVDNDKT